VSVLVRIDEEGRPILAPHESTPAAPVETAPAPPGRGGGRKPRSRSLPGMDDAADAV
jgi:hypothetical protein